MKDCFFNGGVWRVDYPRITDERGGHAHRSGMQKLICPPGAYVDNGEDALSREPQK